MVNIKLVDRMSWEEITEKIMTEVKDTSPAFKKWLLSKEGMGGSFVSSYLFKRIYNIQKSINENDRDHFIVITGKEGCGKSTLALQIASILDPSFNINRVCFKMKDYLEGLSSAKTGEAFILDEGNIFLFSRESYSEDNRIMVKLFALMRQRNLCTIICVPNYFTLDTYVRDHRVDSLFYVAKKGKFCCYVKRALKIISYEGRKNKQVGGHKCPDGSFFVGTFNRDIPTINGMSEEMYRSYKTKHFNEFLEDLKKSVRLREEKSEYVSIKDARKIFPLSADAYKKLIKDKKVSGRKMGNKYFIKRADLLEKQEFMVK